jgi:DNA-binding transcriptional MerR regulator
MDEKIFYSIGEVSEKVDVDDYTLRYWEKEFRQLSPRRRRGGVRMYVENDIELIKRIKFLLYNRKFTIEGAKQILNKKLESEDEFIEHLELIKSELNDILKLLKKNDGA